MTGLWLVSYIAVWLLMLLLLVLVVGALRQIGILYQNITPHLNHLQAGQNLKDIVLSALDGSKVRVSQFTDIPTAFVVTSPGCSSCDKLLSLIRDRDADFDLAQRVVVVSTGDAHATVQMLRATGISDEIPVLVDTDGKVRSEWGVSATPITFVVDDRLTVRRLIVGAIASRSAQPVALTQTAV